MWTCKEDMDTGRQDPWEECHGRTEIDTSSAMPRVSGNHRAVHGTLVVSASLRPHGLQPTRLLPMGFSRQEYWGVSPFPSPCNHQ